MGYRIERITTKKLRRDFFEVPWKIYRDDRNWVPPLRIMERQHISARHNPFLKYGRISLFGAVSESGVMCGRIVAVHNPEHNRIHDKTEGFFGMFECIEEPEVVNLLFEAVFSELRSWGLNKITGPVNFTTNDESGFLIEGFDLPPTFMTNYCPPYYSEFMEKLGFTKSEDLVAYEWKKGHVFPERFNMIAERVSGNRDISIRKFRKKDMDDELNIVEKIYNGSFEGLRGFVPLNGEEIKEMGEGFKLFADYDIILFAEYRGEPVGFCLTLPDLNKVLIRLNGRLFPFGILKLRKLLRKLKSVRLIVLGVLPGYRNMGIVLLLIRQVVQEALDKGYERCELSVVMESNQKMNSLIRALGFKQVKKYRIYSRHV